MERGLRYLSAWNLSGSSFDFKTNRSCGTVGASTLVMVQQEKVAIQVRFELGYYALNPDIKIIAPEVPESINAIQDVLN